MPVNSQHDVHQWGELMVLDALKTTTPKVYPPADPTSRVKPKKSLPVGENEPLLQAKTTVSPEKPSTKASDLLSR